MGLFSWLQRPFASRAVDPVMHDDHTQHFNELDRLLNAISIKNDPADGAQRNEQIRLMTRQMIDDLAQHFRREHELMECYGYTAKDSHDISHRTLLANIEKQYCDFTSGQRPADEQFVNTIKKWLIAHMKSEDRKLGIFLSNARPVGKLGKIIVSQ